MRQLALVWFLLLAAAASASDVPRAYAFSLMIRPGHNAQINHVAIAITEGTLRAVRVYSEPSHTLLAAFLDSGRHDFRKHAWFGELASKHRPVMVAALRAGMKGTLQAPSSAVADTRLVVHVSHAGEGNLHAGDSTFEFTPANLRRSDITVEFPMPSAERHPCG